VCTQGMLASPCWPFLVTALPFGFVLSRYLNGVMKNGGAPVLLELANEVMFLLEFYLNLHKT
jgi:hypothetical protein